MSELKTQEEIQQEVRNLEAQLEHYKQVDPQNVDKHNELANQISELNFSLAQMQEREQQIEEKVTGDEITFNVPGVDFKELPAELITLIDRVVRADRRRIYAEEAVKVDQLTAKHKEEIHGSDEREAQLQRQNEILQAKLEESQIGEAEVLRMLNETKPRLNLAEEKNNDLEQRLKNAAAQLDEANKEIGRLNSEISDYQKAKVFGERDAQKIIDATPQETADMQNLVNSISKKYVSITPFAANWHEAVAEDGSKTVVHTKDLPSLETQGSQFRGNDQTGNQEAVLPSVNQESIFRSAPNVGTVHAPDLATWNVPGESTHEQVEAKTEAERIAELERRVEALESRVA